MKKILMHVLMLSAATFVSTGSNALSFVETTDFADASSPFALSAGTLDLGTNTISGSLVGQCSEPGLFGGNCNGGPGDNQDSVNFTIAAGMQIESITFEFSNFSGPLGVRASVSGTDFDENPFLSFFPQQEYLPESGFLDLFSGGGREAGLYALSAFGQDSLEAGAYFIDYTYTITVSEVPLPGAVWLFASAFLACTRIRKRR